MSDIIRISQVRFDNELGRSHYRVYNSILTTDGRNWTSGALGMDKWTLPLKDAEVCINTYTSGM